MRNHDRLTMQQAAGAPKFEELIFNIDQMPMEEILKTLSQHPVKTRLSLTGSIIGAAFLSSLPELMRDFSTYRMLAYSIVLVLVMLFRPGGIFGRWEFSLNRLLDGIRHPKEKAAKGA